MNAKLKLFCLIFVVCTLTYVYKKSKSVESESEPEDESETFPLLAQMDTIAEPTVMEVRTLVLAT
ncbi:MAG: hypothetical protein LRY45_06425 [Bacteroides graminisolvens]|nr:hypothetical protein [Bacteroides graminisolvens]